MITNALLRLERAKKKPVAPFELVATRPNVWVLELAVPKKKEEVQMRWLIGALTKKKALLARYSVAARATLHLSFSRKKRSPIRLDAALLHLVALIPAGLEIYEEKA